MPGRKPLPHPDDPMVAEYFEHCAAGKLCFQRCTGCHTWRHVPRIQCAQCGSPDWEWAESSGRGTLFSWTVCHQAMHPGFADEVPYAVAVVELEEGVRMVSGLRDVPFDSLTLDLPLKVVFEAAGEGVSLPYFTSA